MSLCQTGITRLHNTIVTSCYFAAESVLIRTYDYPADKGAVTSILGEDLPLSLTQGWSQVLGYPN